MKKLLIILLFLPLFAKAQTVIYTGAITQTTVQKGGYGADRIFVAPLLDTATINGLFPTLRDTGRITINNGTLYYHDGVGWVSTITGTSGNFVTTAQLADTPPVPSLHLNLASFVPSKQPLIDWSCVWVNTRALEPDNCT